MADFFAENWGNLASVFGLVFSILAFGFAKSARDNVDDDELASLRDIAKAWLVADHQALARALAEGLIQEIKYEEEV